MKQGYSEEYYNQYDIGSKTVNYLESTELRNFHASVAGTLTADLHPKTVLDAGCAMGVLVSEFKKLGVQAFGIDYSEYAVENADPVARDTCYQGSLAMPFPEALPKHFDLVTCMEVLEHMTPEDGRKAISNICQVTDTVVFCSSPDDYEDPTHINLQEREYWAACFAENGFFDDLDYRPLFITDYAVCYRKKAEWVDQISTYERYVRITDEKLRNFRDSHYQALEAEHEKAVAEWTKTANTLTALQHEHETAVTEWTKAADALTSLQREHEKAVAEWTATAENLIKLRQSFEELKLSHDKKNEQLQEAVAAGEALRLQYAQLKGSEQQMYIRVQETEKKLLEYVETCGGLKLQYEEMLSAKNSTISELQQCAQAFERRYSFTEDQLKTAREELAQLHKDNQALSQAHASAVVQRDDMMNQLAVSQARVHALQTSTSWKVTAPLRALMQTIHRVVGKTARKIYRFLKKFRKTNKQDVKQIQAAALNWPPKAAAVRPEDAVCVEANCRRACVYALFDKDGIVDEYVLYFLKAISRWAEKIVVVNNGNIDNTGREALEELGCHVICRDNKGFDAWGVKTGLDYLGIAGLAEYDEVIIANNTLFGPVCDLRKMFQAMSGQAVDFWGITSHTGFSDFDPFGCNPYGFIPEHIQSFFYVVRKRLTQGEAFRKFWEELPELPDYNAAVGLYETVMTRYFADNGYIWNCYMDRAAYYDMTDNPLIAMPMESLRDWNSPFFKRRAFFQDYDYLTTFTGQQSASCLKQYIEENTEYPFELVWKNLIRTCHMSDLTQNMHLSWIFDRNNTYAVSNEKTSQLKAALFMHIYDHTMADELARYASSLPDAADIYISTTTEDKKTAISAAFSGLPNKVEIRILPNRGRDVSALLASFKDVVMNYDVACVTHDKKTGYLKPQTVGEGFAYMGYENILGSKTFVQQVIQAFFEDPYLGLLYAPDPNHADFATHVGLEWGANFECTKQLAADLKLHVPMDENHPPMAPFGSSFWFRTKAMIPLFAKDWTYEDFPAEPFNMTDGSILHAVERIYPYVAQHAGYYSALLMTADYAAVDVGNLFYYAQQYAHVCSENGITNRFITVRDVCDARLPQNEGVMALIPQKSLLRRVLWKLREVLAQWANE